MKRTGVQTARKLRRASTDAEKRFWIAVRNRQVCGAKFRRQWPIGPFVADFICLEAKLVVEIDGGQHADNESDIARSKQLNALGYRVIRFWNNDVLQNLEGVIESLTGELSRV